MLGFPKPIDPDDERLDGHQTTYQASRGGYFPEADKPFPAPRRRTTRVDAPATLKAARRVTPGS